MVVGVSKALIAVDVILLIVIVIWIGSTITQSIRRKRFAKVLEEDVFEDGMRKAQVIDLREKTDFDKGHILGARSVPYSMLKQRYVEIRKDLPVYLYDQGMTLSTRAASTLGKQGYKDISILKNGYARWSGKTKTKKY
ncbi:rhodanese-like domain-containing protein [Paucilactobacillus suebicus]|uniref:rhodanese-like domain-containing protein n=1 Tax=Paucilactobacillus suebicus TaxID=152335 RepID=UPI000249041A|nr:rhodanese-like domain-containing protein [Paucilactobacillus suebicus]